MHCFPYILNRPEFTTLHNYIDDVGIALFISMIHIRSYSYMYTSHIIHINPTIHAYSSKSARGYTGAAEALH